MNKKVTIDDLATMVQRGFIEIREDIRADTSHLDSKLSSRIDRLEAKLDYRFDSLSNRIDDLSLTKISRDEHRMLATRVTNLEEEAFPI
jgi:BMFP domain-containing protein YqiC